MRSHPQSRLLVSALALSVLFWLSAGARGFTAQEYTFPVLTIGAHSYTNVTITSQNKKYIFLMHSAGLVNIKVAELPPELRETLGYDKPEEETSKNPAAKATKWARTELATLNISKVHARTLKVEDRAAERIKAMPPGERYGLLAAVLAFSVLFSACLRTLCLKAGSKPGFLIWLPLLKGIPLRRAARMRWTWSLLLLVPGAGAFLLLCVWCYKIAVARGKSGMLGLTMLLPGLGILPFLYLVFSAGQVEEAKPRARGPQLMTLETA